MKINQLLKFLFISYIIGLAIFFGCASNKLPKEEIEGMKARYLLEYGKDPDLWPVMVGLKEEVAHIFAVPVENAVGTNDLNNAITLLRFHGDKIEYDLVRKDFLDNVSGGDFCYLPVFDEEWIGYSQTRGFLLFNVKNGSFKDHIPYTKSHLYITDVRPFPASPFTFIFQVCRGHAPKDDRLFQLLKFDLKGNYELLNEIEQIGRHPIGWVEPWLIQNKTLIMYNEEKKRLEAYDADLKPSSHPFCILFNDLDQLDIEFRDLYELVIHPTLPFALLIESTGGEGNKVWLAKWNNAKSEEKFIEIISQKLSMFSDVKKLIASDFQFSPKGDWLVFRDKSELTGNPLFVAMPIDESEEYFLGKPKILGKVMREFETPTSTCWISEPLSFVVSDGMVLYKWELENLSREF